jgi:hypothetical protein
VIFLSKRTAKCIFEIAGVRDILYLLGTPVIRNLAEEWCQEHFSSFFDQQRWLANIPDLNPLDYCIWNELAKVINWGKVTSKKTLIDRLHRAEKKIRPDVVFESCNSWTRRLNLVARNDGSFLD